MIKELLADKKPTVILIGGTYGSGKSTVARLISTYLATLPDHPLSNNVSIVDYDKLIGNDSGKDIDLEIIDEVRRNTWKHGFINAIAGQIDQGFKLILAPGTFSTRERRERYMQGLAEKADIIGLYFMLPMRITISDIRKSRTDETILVNYIRVLDFYRTRNREFPKEDHSDLLLPKDRTMLPPEFRAMLNKNERNRRLLTTPHDDYLCADRQWVVLTHRLEPQHLISLLDNDSKNPVTVREYLYKYEKN